MSLINQMLQDLDARRAVDGPQAGLPTEVRPLPVARVSHWPLVAGTGFAVLVAAVVGWWYVGEHSRANPAAPLAELGIEAPAAASPTVPLPPEAEAKTQPLPAIPPERRVAAQRMRAERDTGLSLTTSLHSLGETASVTPVGVSGKSVSQGTIEKSLAAGSPNERADSEYRQAVSAVNLGRVPQAIDNLRNALKYDALHSAARQLLFKLLVEAKQLDEAADVLQRGLQVQPNQTAWAMSLARLQVDRGDFSSAWQTLQRSLPTASNNADYQGFAAHILQRLGRSKEAIEYYQVATRLAPAEGRWWLGLGLALENEGRLSEARDAIQRAESSATLSPDLNALAEQKLRQLP